MENEDLIKRINEFLNDNTFEISDPFGIGSYNYNLMVKAKVRILESKKYIVVGDWKELLMYEIIILPTGGHMDGILSDYTFKNRKEIEISTYEKHGFGAIIVKINQLLENFLNYFGIETDVICTKVINGLKS